jgi:superfamily I DNA/RNA helicase
MKLNPEQNHAVRTTQGRVLVLAGAGSGKTRVIAHRIAHLTEQGVPPTAILGLTFTNKAASEMRHRVEGLIGSKLAPLVTLSTFHSFCMQILRREIHHLGYTRDFSLYDERDLRRLIGQMAREMLNHEGELPSMEPTFAALTQANQQALKTEEDDADSPTWHDQFAKDLYGRLQSTLRAYNAVSFDHLITLVIQLFEEHPAVLDRYQERYRYIMIDEYQDTNPAQFRLAELLARKYQNLCVVGDDDQSIYGWRGADVKNILEFKADTLVKLEQNYRSTPIILNAANAVIANNKNRHRKQLWSATAFNELIEVFNAPTDALEAQAVIDRMIRYREELGLKWRDMAILYRSNALSRQFELTLMQASWQKDGTWMRGIPYEIFGGLEFSERSEIKDLLAYLRLIANPLDTEALLRIVNVPRRGISDTFLDETTKYNRSSSIPLWHILEQIAKGECTIGNVRAQGSVRAFVELIHRAKKRFNEGSLSEALAALIEEIQYKRAIEEEVKSENMRRFKWENVQECVNALGQFELDLRQKNKEDEISLQMFISTTTLARQPIYESTKRRDEDKVQLMTLHSAKGLEFPACFIVGLEDHILPHEKSIMETGIEEERRLFYVGITRSRRYLTLSMARSRLKMGKYVPTQPSRFLFELPKELIKTTHAKVQA